MNSGTLFVLFIHYSFFAQIFSNLASEDPFKPVLWLPVSFWHDLINLWARGYFWHNKTSQVHLVLSLPQIWKQPRLEYYLETKIWDTHSVIFGHSQQTVCPTTLQDIVCAFYLKHAPTHSTHVSLFPLPPPIYPHRSGFRKTLSTSLLASSLLILKSTGTWLLQHGKGKRGLWSHTGQNVEPSSTTLSTAWHWVN